MKIFPASLPALPSVSRLGKVALLMGGWAAEREISLQSGRAVLTALQTAGVDTVAIDVNQNIVNVLQEHAFDRAFNVLHGRGGEDGTIQSILEVQKIPYTGSGTVQIDLDRSSLLPRGTEMHITHSRRACRWPRRHLPRAGTPPLRNDP